MKLETRDAVHVSQNDRDRWVTQVVQEVGAAGIFYTMSGDSLVIAFAEGGVVEVLDCLVRRSGLDRAKVDSDPTPPSVWERLGRDDTEDSTRGTSFQREPTRTKDMDTLEHDAALDQVLVAVPEAKDVFIGRRVLNMSEERTYYWAVEVTMPRRDKRFRVINGVETLRASGDTVQEAIAQALRFVHFHKTGTLPAGE